jgi:sigma-70-like protein
VVCQVVAELPERQRLVVFLRYFADLDHARIAEALEIRPGTVAATLHAAHGSPPTALAGGDAVNDIDLGLKRVLESAVPAAEVGDADWEDVLRRAEASRGDDVKSVALGWPRRRLAVPRATAG